MPKIQNNNISNNIISLNFLPKHWKQLKYLNIETIHVKTIDFISTESFEPESFMWTSFLHGEKTIKTNEYQSRVYLIYKCEKEYIKVGFIIHLRWLNCTCMYAPMQVSFKINRVLLRFFFNPFQCSCCDLCASFRSNISINNSIVFNLKLTRSNLIRQEFCNRKNQIYIEWILTYRLMNNVTK